MSAAPFARIFFIVVSILLEICQASAPVSCQRQSQPNKIPCALRGKVTSSGKYYINANPSVANSLNDCRDLCVRRGNLPSSGCQMFSFNQTAKLCNIFRSDDKNNIQQLKSSDNIFFSRKCFKCTNLPCPSKPVSSVNLIDNPGFEASNSHIGPWRAEQGGSGVVDTAAKPLRHPGIKSPSALHVGNDFFFNQDYRHCSGQTHRAEVDLFDVVPNPDLPLRFGAGDDYFAGAGFSFPLTSPPSLPARKVVGFYSATLPEGVIDLSAQTFGSGGSFDFDNAVVRPVDYSSAKAIGKDLVVNGGFEQGARPWNYTAVNLANKPVGKFALVSPGLEGTSQALRWSPKSSKTIVGLLLSLTPTVKPTNTGTLHRLSFRTRPVLTMTLVFSDGSQIFGLTSDDQYFYAEKGMFPLTILFSAYTNPSGIQKAEFDELSIHEIEDLG